MRIVVHDYAGHPFQFDLSRELARRGHDVAHMYFSGDQGPKGAVERRPGDPDGFAVVPVSTGRAYSKTNFVRRVFEDRAYGAAAARLLHELKPEIVISGNTPLDAQGAIIAATHRADGAFINWIQDFYGLAIERLLSDRWSGLGRLVASRYKAMEERQFSKSDGVVLVSDEFRPHVRGFSGNARRMSVIPNWGALGDISVRPKANDWAEQHGLRDRFVFLYSGTLGLKHNPDLLLDLADAFVDRREVIVVVAATGSGRDKLDRALVKQPRSNVMILPLQPFAAFEDVLGTADVVVALLEAEAGEFSVPSKVLSYLCAGRPNLLAAPRGNLASVLIREAGAGEVIAPDDRDGFVAAATRLYQDPAWRVAAGRAARTYAEEHFDIARVADRFEALFGRCLDDRRAGVASPPAFQPSAYR